jgi:hypothetical protein
MTAPNGVRRDSISDVVDSYWIFLARNHYDAHLKMFKRRLEADAKAAEAEAIVFSFLWSAKRRPDIFEDPSNGGPDFRCQPCNQTGFLVEVTSLESGAVAKESKLPAKITGSGGGAFGLITSKLETKASGKARQLGNHPLPRVLAITCSHAFAWTLMDRTAAENLLVADYTAPVPLIHLSDLETTVTGPRQSAFFRVGKSGGIIPRLQSISAVLLVAIFRTQVDVVGVLHPEPSISFAPALFPQVPYLRFKHWPISEGKLSMEWSIAGEAPTTFHHTRIR